MTNQSTYRACLGCIAALILLGSAPVRAADAVAVEGMFNFWSWERSADLAAPPLPFPVDAWGVNGSFGPSWSYPPPLSGTIHMWIYANEAGRVRAFADTAFATTGKPSTFPRNVGTELVWKKTFTKNSAADTAKFTVNKSRLALYKIGGLSGTPPLWPYAKFGMFVTLHRHDLPDTATAREKQVEEFGAEEILTLNGKPHYLSCFEIPGTNIWTCSQGMDKGAYHAGAPSPLNPEFDAHVPLGLSSAELATESYTGTLDLSVVPVGRKYTVEYYLVADAGNFDFEDFSQAFVGDPLDVDSGFNLEVTSPPAADDDKPVRLCDVEFDAARYASQADGTVTDTYTGLMWQRCPAGYALNEKGTPGVMADDRCALDTDADMSWQEALQYAANSESATYTDWRLPNVKELDSIVELGCHAPAIETAPFPDTPSNLFWSSTPGRDGASAFGIGFLRGDVRADAKTTNARVRLVRTGPQPPVQPLPALRIGRPAPLAEGDNGSADLVFPVVLDRPALTDVTVHYQTRDDSARAGEDYVAISGALTIPAGARTAQIVVPVVGDTNGEAPETFYVALHTVSNNARLVVAGNVGEIVDDEPRVSVTQADAYEGDSGSTDLVFTVMLDKPAVTDVMVAYATADGSATGGDYTPASGTILIPAGQTHAFVHVSVTGDTMIEGDESVVLTLNSPSANARLGRDAVATGFIVEDDVPVMQALNDTGSETCVNDLGPADSCPVFNLPGQDAEHGRDATVNNDGDGAAGFALTKLDAAGTALADQGQPYNVTPWHCVRDEVTGLTWEVKTDDGGLRDKDWRYTWFSSSGVNDGGNAGTPNGGTCVDSTNCDIEKYVVAVNGTALCGAGDWRVPTPDELRSLVNVETRTDTPDAKYFPNRAFVGTPYWSSTSTYTGDSAWLLGFTGSTSQNSKNFSAAVRLVRGGN